MKVRDVIKQLEQNGGGWLGQKGAIANITIRPSPGTVTVADHPSVDIPPGTLNNILKQAGLK